MGSHSVVKINNNVLIHNKKGLGVVDAVGKDVTTIKVGQAVALVINNGYSEYLVN